MAINFRSNTIVKNLRVGPLSGGGNGGGGGSSEPSYLAVGAIKFNSEQGKVFVYDTSNLSSSPIELVEFDTGVNTRDEFGHSISIYGSNLVVGASHDDDQATQGGAVYVYDLNNLSTTPTKLAPSSLNNVDNFGISVAATSNHIVVGAYLDEAGSTGDTGAVYVYDINNLSASPTNITPSGLDTHDYFGKSVAATSNQVIVGAQIDDDRGSQAGAVYVYDATNLSTTPTKLTPSGIGAGDEFGSSVAATSNHIVVGASNDDDQGTNAGAVYVYDATNLSTSPTKLTTDSSSANFGKSVAISDKYLVVGEPDNTHSGINWAGAVYVYDVTDLSASPTKLTAFDASYLQYYGTSVSVAGDMIAVGATPSGGSTVEAVYVYDATNLSAAPTKLTAGTDELQYGHSVALG